MGLQDGTAARGSRRVAVQVSLGIIVLGLAAYLLFMSSSTGQEERYAGQTLLDDIFSSGTAIDSTIYPLLFELPADMGSATGAQTTLIDAADAYASLVGQREAAPLLAAASRKAQLVNDFKAQQAVARQSRLTATRMISAMSGSMPLEPAAERAVFEVERAWVKFLELADAQSAERLHIQMDAVAATVPAIAALPSWAAFELHAASFVRSVGALEQLLASLSAVPLAAAIATQKSLLEARYAERGRKAARYRAVLFVVIFGLLLFSGYKAYQVRRAVRLVREANDELERRVEERTRELIASNDALQAEIREREDVETQLRMAQKLESMGQLAAGIAHEINTPTQYVSDNVNFLTTAWDDVSMLIDEYERVLESGAGDTELSRDVWRLADVGYLREEVPPALRESTAGLQQIAAIVRAMKDFSHPGDETPRPADLNRVIESTVTVARNEWKYVADLSLDLDAKLPSVPCNVSLINQVLLNIIVNAAQALEERLEPGQLGHIWVSSRTSGDYCEIAVEDDGPGVPDAIRSQIFDPFFTTKAIGKGTGQGLSIAYGAVQQHDGRLSVTKGRDGVGAKFLIELPLAVSDTAQASSDLALSGTDG